MQEKFLFFIWQHRLFQSETLRTHDGRRIEIIKPGVINSNSGPDFLNAQIRIDDVLWGGQVEMHINSSDWHRHGHHNDPAYENVILHVVWKHDREVHRQDKTTIPVLEISEYSSTRFYQKFEEMYSSIDIFSCNREFKNTPHITRVQWLDRALVGRLEEVSDRILDQLKLLNGDWTELIFRSLARSLGLKVNAQAMTLLSESIPYKIIARLRNRPHAIEALLFGQSGLIVENLKDPYPRELKREYQFLKKMYDLKPLNPGVFRFMRMHPSAFPTMRIAQLAALLRSVYPLTTMLDTKFNRESLFLLLDVNPHFYWKHHYRFDVKCEIKSGNPGAESRIKIILNTIVPIQFALYRHTGKSSYRERCENLLNSLPSEKNRILNEWSKIGVVSESAAQSQALHYHFKHFCSAKNCLNCLIGKNVLLSQKDYDSQNN